MAKEALYAFMSQVQFASQKYFSNDVHLSLVKKTKQKYVLPLSDNLEP